MTREFFNKQFAALVVCYPNAQKLADEAADVYFEMLHGIPEEKFIKGVKSCLAQCKFFPTIAELGEAALPAKRELSSYQIQTKNGLDRVWLRVGWEVQIQRMEREQGFEELPEDFKPLVKMLADSKAVK